MTAIKAGNMTKKFLKDKGIIAKVTAKTVSFSDLARDGAVFVSVSGITPETYRELKEFAKTNGFFVN